MEGQGDTRLDGVFANLPRGGLPHSHAFAALVLVGVQADGVEPGGCVGAGFADGFGKRVGVSGHAEQDAHSLSPLMRQSSRKGASMP